MLNAAPLSGFEDPTMQSQAAFRAVMDAMAHPGRIYTTPEPMTAPAPLNNTAAMVALSLCDFDTPIWLDHDLANSKELAQYLTFHTGAPITKDPKNATFAFISNPKKIGLLSQFALGSDEYPDRSTTLVLQVEALTNSAGVVLSGPGIQTTTNFGAAPLPEPIWEMARENHTLYPRGVDMIFCSSTELACLPRSTKIGKGV